MTDFPEARATVTETLLDTIAVLRARIAGLEAAGAAPRPLSVPSFPPDAARSGGIAMSPAPEAPVMVSLLQDIEERLFEIERAVAEAVKRLTGADEPPPVPATASDTTSHIGRLAAIHTRLATLSRDWISELVRNA